MARSESGSTVTPSVTYPAPAKLNLFLHVVGRRADGYHELQTLFRFVDVADRLAFDVRADGVIRRVVDVPGVAENEDLAVRAARLLQRAAGVRLGADIWLEKRLPMGGGLGGGSSDAATTLVALNHLWQAGLRRPALQALALRLGADVPVFVFGRSAFGEGIGERLRAIRVPDAWYVVICPAAHVATARIFAQPDLTRDTDPITIAAFSKGWAPVAWGRNDLEPVVTRLYPEVASALQWLSRYGAARLTGSGACVFCAFDSEREAQAVLADKPDHLKGFIARGIDEHPLYGLVDD
jgi:4-diphosphocytidyl-2-C-methyl-D-erythritol kinase